MASKRIGPEAKIISMFTALSDDSKRIVMDIIKSQTVRAPKSVAPAAGKKSKQKSGEQKSIPSTDGKTESVGNVSSADKSRFVPICTVCGNEKDFQDHLHPSPHYHKFESSLKKRAPVLLPDNPEGFLSGATA